MVIINSNIFFGLLVHGEEFFEHIFKLIGIDAMHLCEKYLGVLLMTTILDGNGKFIPVELSIAKVGCALTWEWFVNHIKIFLAVDSSSMTIVCDRHME